ncbi:MAG: amidohydrolase family protein [Lachnospiraceae bacterium]|nr:amidohydrolase family protein [Lachnospiraceae bacterium]
MIIDMHTHTFPDKIAGYALAGMEREILEKRGYDFHVRLKGTRDALSASTVKNGVDLSVVIPVATKPTQSVSINRFAYETNAHWEQTRVFSFGAIHPDNENYKEVLRDVKAMGLKGIKLHPDYQRVCFDDRRYLQIMDYASELGLVIVTHAGEDFGLPEKVHCTPDMVLEVLKHIQPDKLVLAHMGGLHQWDEVEEKLIGCNVYLDTAFVTEERAPHLEQEQFVRMVRNHGVEKILFGTDSPWSDQGEAIRKVQAMGFSQREQELILGENAKKLLAL